MRILNPGEIGLAPLPSRVEFPAHSLTLVAKVAVSLRPGGVAELEAPPHPFPTGDEPYPDDEEGLGAPRYESDYAPFKPGADVLLVGHFHAPGGRPVERAKVVFAVGGRKNRLALTGARSWKRGLLLHKSTEPEPFSKLELRWEHAFGGPRIAANPVGLGHTELPRIERLDELVVSRGQKPRPAGFGPVSRQWEERRRLLGTFNSKWLKTRWPWFPANFDWKHFHAAVPELRFSDYLSGDETLSFENLHPELPEYETRLPGLRAIAAVQRIDSTAPEGVRIEPVTMRLDTLWVDMDSERALLVWRGWCTVKDADFSDLAHAWAEVESSSQPLTEARVMEQARRAIRDHEEQWAITEEAPPPEASPTDAESPEPSESSESDEEPTSPVEPSKEDQEHQAAAAAFAAEAAAMVEKWEGPPEPDEEAPAWNRERLHEVLQAGGSVDGEDLSGIDLEGDDLSGCNLSGAVMTGANLARANLSGADLTHTDLENANLEAADLTGSKLVEANLSGSRGASVHASQCDLSGALLMDAAWDGARLDGAALLQLDATDASLVGADLRGASLGDAVFENANLNAANLNEVQAKGAYFVGASMRTVQLERANLCEVDFSAADLEEAILDGADLTDATLEETRAARARAVGACVKGLRASGVDLTHAVFERVEGEDPIFDGAVMAHLRLAHARIAGADFSGADLRQADIYASVLCGAKFAKANLSGARLVACDCFEAVFEGAQLENCDGSESSFYGAEFLDAEMKGFHGRERFLAMTKLAGVKKDKP